MGSLKHIQAPLLQQSQWVLLMDRQKVGLCSKYEGFYHFLDGTDSDMLLYTVSIFPVVVKLEGKNQFLTPTEMIKIENVCIYFILLYSI